MDSLKLLAQYNIWATQKLNKSLKKVSREDLLKDNGLFFKSIFATLNHLLVGEHYLWFPRFKDGISHSFALNAIMENNPIALLNELEEKSYHWLNFLDQLDESKLLGNLNYTTSGGTEITVPYHAALYHVFMHGTHHRGQITTALTNMGYDCPEIDLIYMLLDKNYKANGV